MKATRKESVKLFMHKNLENETLGITLIRDSFTMSHMIYIAH